MKKNEYLDLAKALQIKSEEGRFDLFEAFEIELNGTNITVGPFMDVARLEQEDYWNYDDGYFWTQDKNDGYALQVNQGNSESWGEEESYSRPGVGFYVYETKVVEVIVLKEEIYKYDA